MSLSGQNILITGASMGIGAAIAQRLAKEGANLILTARSEDKLKTLAQDLQQTSPSSKILTYAVNVRDHKQLDSATRAAVAELGPLNVLINNAGLAIGAPRPFPELSIEEIVTMTETNINGFMFAAHCALNAGQMLTRKRGTILNITSTTALEVPPFPGESVYHASKATQEAFSNALRTELTGTNIKIQVLRPGVVATNFHELRVGYDKGMYDSFMEGLEPLVAGDVAEMAAFVLGQGERVCVKALDVVPTGQRSLSVFDRTWKERNEKR